MVIRRSYVLVDAVNRIKTSTFDPAKYFDVSILILTIIYVHLL